MYRLESVSPKKRFLPVVEDGWREESPTVREVVAAAAADYSFCLLNLRKDPLSVILTNRVNKKSKISTPSCRYEQEERLGSTEIPDQFSILTINIIVLHIRAKQHALHRSRGVASTEACFEHMCLYRSQQYAYEGVRHGGRA
jgi:hypothetical protein